MKKKIFQVFGAVMIVLIFVGVASSCAKTKGLLDGVALNITEITVDKGQTLCLKVEEGAADYINVTWSSANPGTATVSNGIVSAVGKGQTNIYAAVTAYGNSGAAITTLCCKVTVTELNTPLLELGFAENTVSVKPGDSVLLQTVFSPSNASGTALEWSSDKPEIASVNKYGLVCALSLGTAVITVTDTTSGLSAECSVSVTEQLSDKATLSETSISLATGDSKKLSVISTGSGEIQWSSDNDKVAAVDESGIVTATGQGTTVIHAICGNTELTCTVSVTAEIGDEIAINLTTVIKIEGDGHKYRLKTTDGDFGGRFISANNKIVEPDKDGWLDFGKTYGETIVRYRLDGKTYATCKIYYYQKLESAEIPSKVTVAEGETVTIGCILNDGGYTTANISYGVSPETVATVSRNGKVTGVSAGTATVIVRVQQNDIVIEKNVLLTVTAPSEP